MTLFEELFALAREVNLTLVVPSRAEGVCDFSASASPCMMSAPAGTWMLEPAKSPPIGFTRPPRHSAKKPSVTALKPLLFPGGDWLFSTSRAEQARASAHRGSGAAHKKRPARR